MFGTKDKGELTCRDKSPCIVPATFVDKHTLLTDSLPRSSLNLASTGENVGDDGFTVEASVYQGGFTENKIRVYYIHDLEYKKLNKASVPSNIQMPIMVDTDFHWDLNDYDKVNKHANFTCRFKVKDEVVYTEGRMDGIPLGSLYDDVDGKTLPNHVVCASPKIKNFGKGKMDISVNGHDYSGNFDFEFTEPVDLYRV